MKRLLFGLFFAAGLLAFTNSKAQVYVKGTITIGAPLPQVYCAPPPVAVYSATPYYRERVVVAAPVYQRRYYDRRYERDCYDRDRYDRDRYDDRCNGRGRGHHKHWENGY